MSTAALDAWGWRIPFLLGLVVGIAGYILRRHVLEIGVAKGVYYGALPAVLVEAAPPRVRCTAVALGYNLCVGLFGGLSPIAATWLGERTGDEIAPAFLMMASAAMTFVTLFWFRETYRTAFGVPFATAGGAVR
jgi:hypothetical protein